MAMRKYFYIVYAEYIQKKITNIKEKQTQYINFLDILYKEWWQTKHSLNGTTTTFLEENWIFSVKTVYKSLCC